MRFYLENVQSRNYKMDITEVVEGGGRLCAYHYR